MEDPQRTGEEVESRAATRERAAGEEAQHFTNVALDDESDGDEDAASGSGSEDEVTRKAAQEAVNMESDRLNPEEKAAHEAATLPLGDTPGEDQKEVASGKKAPQPSRHHGLRKAVNKRWRALNKRVLRRENPLPAHPTASQKAADAMRCPPHGHVGQGAAIVILPLIRWLAAYAALGAQAKPADGPIFILVILIVLAMALGWIVTQAKLPPLLGMLLAGILLRNVLPGLNFDGEEDADRRAEWNAYSSILRGLALVIILMRAGLGLDPDALKRLSGMVFRLAFTPCLVEATTVAVASHFILDFPWLWGFLLGFVLAAVSPAVVVPCLLQLQERGLGVDKGIPTLVIAAASIDDVLAISAFTILLGIAVKPGENDVLASIGQGPLVALAGLVGGCAWGLICTFLPGNDDPHMAALRLVFLMGGGIVAQFGTPRINLDGAGALAVLVMAFVAGVGWRRRGWSDSENRVAEWLAKAWIIFQPILFGLIGTEIKLSALKAETVAGGVAVLAIGLVLRLIASFLTVAGGNLALRERLFVSLAWLPKATVQVSKNFVYVYMPAFR